MLFLLANSLIKHIFYYNTSTLFCSKAFDLLERPSYSTFPYVDFFCIGIPPTMFICLQIGAGICAVLTAVAVATGELNKTLTVSGTRLIFTPCVRDPSGLVLHGKQPWLTMMYVHTRLYTFIVYHRVIKQCLPSLSICVFGSTFVCFME